MALHVQEGRVGNVAIMPRRCQEIFFLCARAKCLPPISNPPVDITPGSARSSGALQWRRWEAHRQSH